MIVLMNFRIVTTVWYLFLFFILCRGKRHSWSLTSRETDIK